MPTPSIHSILDSHSDSSKNKEAQVEKEAQNLLRLQWTRHPQTEQHLVELTKQSTRVMSRLKNIRPIRENTEEILQLLCELQALDKVINLVQEGEYKCQTSH